ncbi:MAG: hypothetical protein U5K43_07025 [Halofilum sp. (in: g-proteobacteria)]|nr:hypothetical protein [Halofilum sp. (in: g-proteobacteria)]
MEQLAEGEAQLVIAPQRGGAGQVATQEVSRHRGGPGVLAAPMDEGLSMMCRDAKTAWCGSRWR